MQLGTAGVQPGTAYLLCREATTRPVHRTALKSEAARHTALGNLFSGGPARGIINPVMREFGPINPVCASFPPGGGDHLPPLLANRAGGDCLGSLPGCFGLTSIPSHAQKDPGGRAVFDHTSD